MSLQDKKRKRILKRIFVGLTLFILSTAFLLSAHLFFGDSLANLGDGNPLVLVFLTTLFVVSVYPPVDQLYSWLFRHILFPRRSRILFHLNHLAQELAVTTDLAELANLLVNTLGEVLHLKTVSLLVRSPSEGDYLIASAYGWSITDYRRLRFAVGSPFLELLKAVGPRVLLREKVSRSLSWQEANQLMSSSFELVHANCVIPLWVKNELIGSINFLIPSSHRPLDEGDLRVLEDFGEEVARSVRNTLTIQGLKILNEELRDTQSQLLQNAKLTAIEQLAAGIAHEIHNPLTIISGKAQVLLLQRERKGYDEKVEEVLKTIVKQTRRAADITKKLLMFSRTSASPREKLRLEGVLEDTISVLSYQTSLEGIEIRRCISPDLPDFYGNVQEVREIFLNLLLNALQAIGPGGLIQIGITFQKNEKLFVIQVADNGPGILPENLDKVFNPFFTTRPEGLGLGLFVTQQIIHRYGGAIRAESEAGEGTLFVIEIPYQDSPSPSPSGLMISEREDVKVRDPAVSRGG